MSLYFQYDPSRQAISWRGIEMLAPMDGVFLSIDMQEDATELHVGAAGDATFVRNLNNSAIIVVTLKAESPTNDFLSAALIEDRLLGTGFGPFLYKDLNGTTIVEAPIAKLQRVPLIEVADVASGRPWTFLAADCIAHVGSALVGF